MQNPIAGGNLNGFACNCVATEQLQFLHMGAGNMAEYLDFFNIYIMGVIETSFQFYFLAKILKKKIWPPFYFLFAVGAVIVAVYSGGTIVGFVVFVLLISICGASAMRILRLPFCMRL